MSEAIKNTDVAIVGGGPAGCAAALMLRSHAPALSVSLLEASDYQAPRLGETLPPLVRPMLRQLGLLPSFEAFCQEGGARPVHGTNIQWGDENPHHESYLLHARGVGWHLDRRRFDAFLAQACQDRGVDVQSKTRVRGLDPVEDAGAGESRSAESRSAWHLRLESTTKQTGTLKARFVVDAAGRSAPIARRVGAKTEMVDRLVAFARYFEASRADATLTVEAFEDGWWYSAGLPGDRAVVVCLSDADLARNLGLHEKAGWNKALAKTELTARRAKEFAAASPLIVRSAATRYLQPAAGNGWLAVGDAASVFDPLSSQGLTKSIRSGIFAAYAISDFLVQQDRSGIERYRRFISDEFESYQRTRTEVYAAEQRWPQKSFWRRRQAEAPGPK